MNKPRILIVEEESAVALDIENNMQKLGYEVTSIVNTGEKAVEQAECEKPDIVLMDVNLNSFQSHFNIPIVFTVNSPDEHKIRHSQIALPFGYVLKPIQERELRVAIEMALIIAKKDAELRTAEDELLQSRARIRSIADNAEQGIIVYQDNEIKYSNSHACNVLDYSKVEVSGRPFADFIHPDDLAVVNERHERRMDGEKEVSITNFRVLTKNQEIRWAQNKPIMIEWEGKPAILSFINDITEQKQAVQALRESEEKYRQLIDNSPDLIYRTDQTGKITFASQSVKGLSGYSDEEAIGMNMAAEVYLHPEERDRFLSELTKNGSVHDFQAELKRKDGSIWWASTNARLIKDHNGNFLGVEGFTRDITEAKQTENALLESQEKFRLITRQSLMGIILIQDGRFQYVNETTAKIFEYSVNELMAWGKEEFSKLVHPEDMDFVMDQARKKQAGVEDVITHYTYRGVTRSGKVKWIELYSSTVIYQGKTADLVTLIDRTERRQAENALKDSEEKYRMVVMNAIEAICIIQDVRFKYFNPETVRLFGYCEKELAEMSADDVVYPDDKAQVISRRLQRESGEQSVGNYSHRIITKDGNIRWVDLKSVTITWHNRPAVLVFLTDITEKKQTQELMVQTEKMMSVGGLAAGMAHELNNPLGGMLQGVQNIQRRFSLDLKSNYKPAEECGVDLHNLQLYMEKRGINGFLDGIKESGRKASGIISNMLQFSRKSESHKAPTDLAKLVENTLELAGKDYDLKRKYDFRRVSITKEFDPDLPLVPCTETEIEQVILNLLSNATYSMANVNREGPDHITIRLIRDRNMARIEVEDNGPGMDEGTRKRIFEPFFTTKPVGEGTGLGLSVSYMIITNNHQGTLEVASALGQGTKFLIQLPLD